jgi:hypothetical protein
VIGIDDIVADPNPPRTKVITCYDCQESRDRAIRVISGVLWVVTGSGPFSRQLNLVLQERVKILAAYLLPLTPNFNSINTAKYVLDILIGGDIPNDRSEYYADGRLSGIDQEALSTLILARRRVLDSERAHTLAHLVRNFLQSYYSMFN